MVHTLYPSTGEVEAGVPGVQGQPQLHKEFEALGPEDSASKTKPQQTAATKQEKKPPRKI